MNQRNTNIQPELQIENIGPTGPGQNIFINSNNKRDNNKKNQIHCKYLSLRDTKGNNVDNLKNITLRQTYPYHQYPYYPMTGKDYLAGIFLQIVKLINWNKI